MSLSSPPSSLSPSPLPSLLHGSATQHDLSSTLQEGEGDEEGGEGSTSSTEEMVEGTESSPPPSRYYLQKLREFAPHFWGREESSDCTILLQHGQSSTPYHLHFGYVAPQSSVLYNAFMGRFNPSITPLDRASYASPLPSPHPSPHFPTSPLGAGRDLNFETPTIHLSLPDPTSFDLILHFLYWGDASVVEDALDRGICSWEGMVDNLRVLNIGPPLKKIVGKWWQRNNPPATERNPTSPRGTRLPTPPYLDSDSQT